MEAPLVQMIIRNTGFTRSQVMRLIRTSSEIPKGINQAAKAGFRFARRQRIALQKISEAIVKGYGQEAARTTRRTITQTLLPTGSNLAFTQETSCKGVLAEINSRGMRKGKADKKLWRPIFEMPIPISSTIRLLCYRKIDSPIFTQV